ncbi:hypothetical protein ES705_21182 [subsurface metagenome]
MNKNCQIVVIGHTWQKLMFSIDKEVFDKLIFISEKEQLPGSERAAEVLENLTAEYRKRKMKVEHRKFNFSIATKPIAEMTHLIYQQKLLGFNNIIINIIGGLRYVDLWIYLAASIARSRIIHGDFIYDGNIEVGIYKNVDVDKVYLGTLTSKQVEFLELFFPSFKDPKDFFNTRYIYDENPLFNQIIYYNSIEKIRNSLIKLRGKEITRGAINGFIKKLNRISALKITHQSEKKRKISISYIGIAYFLKEMYKKILEKSDL